MSNTYTERELREHQRGAFVDGAAWYRARNDWGLPCTSAGTEAEIRFPKPQITRPRVLELGSNRYRVVNGVVEFKTSQDTWVPSAFNDQRLFVKDITPANAKEWIEILRLIENPTETVDG